MITKTAGWGVELFQICDYPLIESYDDAQLAALRTHAKDSGVALELGTRGVRPEHLRPLPRAGPGARRHPGPQHDQHRRSPTDVAEAVELLGRSCRGIEAAGVTVALETYEQVPVDTLVDIVQPGRLAGARHLPRPGQLRGRAGVPRPAPSMRTAPYVRNLHVKDFAFSRQDGWVGFTFAGCPLGEGLLDYDFMIDTVRPDERGINQIIEHWLPWQGDSATTCQLEDQWTLAQPSLSKEQASMSTSTSATDQLTIAVVGAGGKMGMRVSNNLQRSSHNVFYSENSPAGQQRTTRRRPDGHRHRHRGPRRRRGDPGRARRRPRPGLQPRSCRSSSPAPSC